MADTTKAPSKAGENTLSLLGTLATIGGNLLLGPDSNIDFGTPFHMGAAELKSGREQKNLMELLHSTKATAPIAQVGQALHDAGGIVNNADLINHPEIQSALGLDQGGGVSSSSFQPGQSPVPTIQNPTQPTMDVSSDAFLQKAAALRPDIAEKLLLDKAAKANTKTDPLNDILKVLQIQNYETPEQKRQAALNDRMDILNATDKLIGARQTENIKERQSYLNTAQTDKIAGLDGALTSIRSLPDQAPALSQTAAIMNMIPIAGPAAVTQMYPEFAQLNKQMQDVEAQIAFARGGKNLTGTEKELTLNTMPNFLEDPSFYPIIKKNTEARINLIRLSELNSMAANGKNVSDYVDPQQLEDYKVWKQIVTKQGTKVFDDPEVQGLMENLGLSGLIIPKKK